MTFRPDHLDLKRDEGLSIRWNDGRESFYPVLLLRRLSPSAEARELRDQMEKNPLTVLTPSSGGPIEATDAELVGRYALRLTFSDGHRTGLYTWKYLRQIDPNRPVDEAHEPDPEADPVDL